MKTDDYISYHIGGEAFCDALRRADLLYEYELPLTTTVVSLITQVSDAMKSSSSQYRFVPNPSVPGLHGRFLELLHLKNRGIKRRSTGQVYLGIHLVHESLTLADLLADRQQFSHDRHILITQRLVVCLGMSLTIYIDHYLLIISILAVKRLPVSHKTNGNLHSCRPGLFQAQFRSDTDIREINEICPSDEERDWRRAQEQREEPTDEEEDIYPAPTSVSSPLFLY